MKKYIKYICFFTVNIIIFLILMSTTYLLPNKRIRENITYSANNTYRYEGQNPKVIFIGGTVLSKISYLDNYTDALIFDVAYDAKAESDTVLERAVENAKYEDLSIGPLNSLQKLLNGEENANSNYTRYWIGVICILRPLLLLFNYDEIRYINMLVILALFVYVIQLIQKSFNTKYAFGFALSMILGGIIFTPFSMQYLPSTIITFLSIIILLKTYQKKNSIKDLKMDYFFLLIGQLTAFFDFLSFPLMTFGIPIIITILLLNKENQKTIKDNILLIIKTGLLWGLGYALTYLSKWIISSLILGNDEITVAWQQFLFRANASGNKKSIITTLYKNIQIYFNEINILLIITYLITYVTQLYIKKISIKFDKNVIIPLLVISLIPYAWYCVMANHSYVHCWMTYKIQIITLFGIFSILFHLTEEKESKKVI